MPDAYIDLYKDDFSIIHQMITEARDKSWRQVNHTLITLYWNIGKFLHEKVSNDGWGQSAVQGLSDYILSRNQGIKGFSARNIWRMKQFYEAYKEYEKLPTLLTGISWSNHLHILSKTKTIEEKEFYLTLSSNHFYTARDFARLIDSCTFERTILADTKLSTALTEFPVPTKGIFKDSYVFEFLGLPEAHYENSLRKTLLKHLKNFLLELGPDFTIIGEEYPLQVGMKDYRVDLLMHHRGLNCLIAVELKVTEFQPEYLGKMQFYLEALDQNLKKSHENPSIGMLICKEKDEEVVKYALNRNISPTLIAEYETKLVDKALLQRKLHEIRAILDQVPT